MASKKTYAFTSDDILGKDAVDPDGGILGVIVKLHIDKASQMVTGITIDQGFMKPNLFIGSEYIRHFGIDTVLLNRVPTDTYLGLKVLTSSGRDIGKVKEVLLQKKKIKKLIVTIGSSFRTKEIRIPASDILDIGLNVVVKDKSYE